MSTGGIFLVLGVIFLITLDSKVIALPFLVTGAALLATPAWRARTKRRPGRDRSGPGA